LDWHFPIKSIHIPQGKHLTLYNLACFGGKAATFSKSVDCLDNLNFELLEKFPQIDVFDNKKGNLRRSHLKGAIPTKLIQKRMTTKKIH